MSKQIRERGMLLIGIFSFIYILVKALIYFRWIVDGTGTWIGALIIGGVLFMLAR